MRHHPIKKIKKILLISIATLTTVSCSGFFDKDNTPIPEPLTQYQFSVQPTLAWSINVGPGSAKHDYLKMSPSQDELNIYTASTDGYVTAINKQTGRVVWQKTMKAKLSTGPGVGDGLVVVANHIGDVFALDQASGKLNWQVKLTGDFIAKPAVGNNIVTLKSLNGLVTSLSTSTGAIQWSEQQMEPTLLLRGASAPMMANQAVLVGYANGSLAKFNVNNGELAWLQTIAMPEGAFAIQRMVDIDADPIIFKQQIYVATYQGHIASLDWATGRIKWSQQISSYTGMTADENRVFITDANSRLYAFNTTSGNINWQQNKLTYRRLSGPAMLGNALVVGDGQGYLHFLAKLDGHLLGRVSVDSTAIYATPLTDEQTVYALTTKGHLAAYRIRS